MSGYWSWWWNSRNWYVLFEVLSVIVVLIAAILLMASIFFLPVPFNLIPSGVVILVGVYYLCKFSYEEYVESINKKL